ncbi:hypothetical protein Tco_1104063 [Tanacetum coccineum]
MASLEASVKRNLAIVIGKQEQHIPLFGASLCMLTPRRVSQTSTCVVERASVLEHVNRHQEVRTCVQCVPLGAEVGSVSNLITFVSRTFQNLPQITIVACAWKRDVPLDLSESDRRDLIMYIITVMRSTADVDAYSVGRQQGPDKKAYLVPNLKQQELDSFGASVNKCRRHRVLCHLDVMMTAFRSLDVTPIRVVIPFRSSFGWFDLVFACFSNPASLAVTYFSKVSLRTHRVSEEQVLDELLVD